MGLFTNDFLFQDEQKQSARVPKGMTLSPEQERAERMEHARELREHQRWRTFAWLLFVAPVLIAVMIILAQYIVARVTAP